jgi:anti-sigma regulatory factor (Ser/Thr protein kinase)
MRTRVRTAVQPATDVRFCLVFPREAISVPVMRRVLGDALIRLGVREDCVSDLLLAVTEACTNVLRHSGYGRGYEIVAHVGKNRCVLEVVDNGRGFDPTWLPIRRAALRGALGSRPSGLSLRSVSRLRRYRPGPASPYSAPRAPAAPGGPAAPSAPAMPSALRSPLSRVRRGAQQRAIAQLPESGRGLAIMRAFVDDVTLHSRPGHGTVVWLAKRIELRNDGPLARAEVVPLRHAG